MHTFLVYKAKDDPLAYTAKPMLNCIEKKNCQRKIAQEVKQRETLIRTIAMRERD